MASENPVKTKLPVEVSFKELINKQIEVYLSENIIWIVKKSRTREVIKNVICRIYWRERWREPKRIKRDRF